MAVVTGLTVLLVTYFSCPVTGVRVEGARMYPESEARNAVNDYVSLLTLNEEDLKRKVESNPWVEGVKVNENWKSGIVTIEVEERRPVLDAEVDGRRIILSSDGKELPGLGGASLARVELDRDQVGEIVEFASVLNRSGVTLESVDGAGAGGIEATVEGRPVIFSGDVSERQVLALKDIMPEHPEARIFDLRSPHRVVVDASAPDQTNSELRG